MTAQLLPLYRFRIYSIPPESGATRCWVMERVAGGVVESVYWRVPDGQPGAGGTRFVWSSQAAAYAWLESWNFAPPTVASRVRW